MPSQCGDSLPTVAIESMALGTPVVASNLGGLTELIDYSRGRLVEYNRVDLFVSAITVLLEDRELAKNLGEKSFQYAIDHLAMENRGEKLVQIYEELLTEK